MNFYTSKLKNEIKTKCLIYSIYLLIIYCMRRPNMTVRYILIYEIMIFFLVFFFLVFHGLTYRNKIKVEFLHGD